MCCGQQKTQHNKIHAKLFLRLYDVSSSCYQGCTKGGVAKRRIVVESQTCTLAVIQQELPSHSRYASQIVLHDYLCQSQSQSERGFSIQLLDEGWRATLEPVSFGRKELSVAFSSMFLLVTFHEMLIWNNVRGLGKESLQCFCWHRQACQQEFGRTTQFRFSL